MSKHVSRPTVHDAVGEASSLLVEAESTDSERAATCTDLLHPEGDGEHLLWVTYTRGPDEKLRSWRRHTDSIPGTMAVVSVGDTTRSAVTASAAANDTKGPSGLGDPAGEPGPVEVVENPSDLTGLGIQIGQFLEAWDGEAPTTVCFDSLTAMLQYTELETAYRFLHILTGRLATVGAVGHFHIDPGGHDEQTLGTLRTLFDGVVRLEDGERTVRTR